MKKLICIKEVEELIKQGGKTLYIDANTIITPSAKDAAKGAGITFCEGSQPTCTENICCENTSFTSNAKSGELDSNMIYNVIKTLSEKGMLPGIFDSADLGEKPYTAVNDCSGLKIVRGNSVKYEVLDTGNPNNKVFYQEIVNSDDGSSMNAGFITIENCNFDWECACQELYHIVEGTLTVKAGSKAYIAQPGDSVFFPKGVKVEFGSPNKMKAFYATY